MSPFKPNSSRVDKLENQILNLKERIAKLERDLTYHIKIIIQFCLVIQTPTL